MGPTQMLTYSVNSEPNIKTFMNRDTIETGICFALDEIQDLIPASLEIDSAMIASDLGQLRVRPDEVAMKRNVPIRISECSNEFTAPLTEYLAALKALKRFPPGLIHYNHGDLIKAFNLSWLIHASTQRDIFAVLNSREVSFATYYVTYGDLSAEEDYERKPVPVARIGLFQKKSGDDAKRLEGLKDSIVDRLSDFNGPDLSKYACESLRQHEFLQHNLPYLMAAYGNILGNHEWLRVIFKQD